MAVFFASFTSTFVASLLLLPSELSFVDFDFVMDERNARVPCCLAEVVCLVLVLLGFGTADDGWGGGGILGTATDVGWGGGAILGPATDDGWGGGGILGPATRNRFDGGIGGGGMRLSFGVSFGV